MQKKTAQRESVEYHANCYAYYLAAVAKYTSTAVKERILQNAEFHKRHLDALRAKQAKVAA